MSDSTSGATITLALCGDVMLGRGVDQILPHPGDPTLHETFMASALGYVELAERVSGLIARPVGFDYVWGDALAALRRVEPDARIVNLETSITRAGKPWPKGINYRMNPNNVRTLTAAGIDCCVLANNHVLDWGFAGLDETLGTLHRAGIHTAGAGGTREAAAAPAVIEIAGRGRVLVLGFASATSGVPPQWGARDDRAGVNLLPDLRTETAAALARAASATRANGDVLVASIHWGGNWGYDVPAAFRAFAHALVDGGFDVVHGHSSHHPLGLEFYRERPILYGCGDFVNDYEGISGFDEYRPELTLLYLPRLSARTGELVRLDVIPFRIRKFRLNAASTAEAAWLQARLWRESAPTVEQIAMQADGTLRVLPRR